MTLQERLFAMAEMEYGHFQAKLIPTVDPALILGVRMPNLRTLAREISGSAEAEDFLRVLPHTYYEENQLHAALIERIRDYPACLSATERFLPFVDNWATCDSFSPKVFGKNRTALLEEIRRWITSEKTYTVRFAVKQLMTWYLDESFFPECLAMVAAVDSADYYVKMMVAWFLRRHWQSSMRRRSPTWNRSVFPSGSTIKPFKRLWRVTASPLSRRYICEVCEKNENNACKFEPDVILYLGKKNIRV